MTPRAPWRVAAVTVLAHGRLHVRFNDGLEGEVDLTQRLACRDCGVFASLRNPEVFRAVTLEHGAVTWPGDIDLAPDAMHDAIQRNGTMVL